MTQNTSTKAPVAKSTAKGGVSKSTARKATTTEVALTDAELKAQAAKLAEAYTAAANQEATTLATIADLSTVVGVARVYMARTAYRLAVHPAILTDYAAKRITNANAKAVAEGRKDDVKPLANISGAITATGAKKTAFAIAFDGGARLARTSDVDVESTNAPTAREVEIVAAAWAADAKRKAAEAKRKAEAPKADVPATDEGDDTSAGIPGDGLTGSDAVLAANRFAATVGMIATAGVKLSADQVAAVEAVIAEAMALLTGTDSE